MKQKLLFFSAFLSFGLMTVNAQITVDRTDFVSIGDTIWLGIDNDISDINIGGTGQQTWSFRTMQVDDTAKLEFIDPSSPSSGVLFPTAEIAMKSSGQLVYATLNATGSEIVGSYASQAGSSIELPVIFSNPQTLVKLPLDYLDAYQDTGSSKILIDASAIPGVGAIFDSIMVVHHVYTDNTADAHGVLNNVNETFDALRVKTIQMTFDTIFGKQTGGNWQQIPEIPGFLDKNPSIDTSVVYNWYAKGEGYPIFTVTMDSTDLTPLSATFKITAPVYAGLFGTTETCFGECNGTAKVTAVSGTAPFEYLWDDINNSTTDSIAGICPGMYSVTVTDANGDSAFASLEVMEGTEIEITISTVDAKCETCADGSAQALVVGGTGNYAYTWDNDTSKTAEIVKVLPNDYTITVKDGAGCSNSETGTIGFWPVGIAENTFVNDFNIYPNPTTGVLFLESNLFESIHIFDVTGKLVWNTQNLTTSFNNQLDVSALEAGIYFIVAENKSGVKKAKFTLTK